MKLRMYSLYDKVCEIYSIPFCSHNDGSALRSVGMMFCENDGLHSRNDPADFRLFRVGEFADDTAVIEVVQNPVLLTEVSAYIVRVKGEVCYNELKTSVVPGTKGKKNGLDKVD